MTNWYDNVPTPMDANGREVPMDTKELVCNGATRKVYGLAYSTRRACWRVAFVDEVVSDLSACTLPDSWERLEQDAANKPCDYFGVYCPNGCDGCPAESYMTNLHKCYKAMARDIIRRAKDIADSDAND